MLYSMHTDSPILQEAEERQNKMLDCDYSKVNIGNMLSDVDIDSSSKDKLKIILYIFIPGLFGRDLGKLQNGKPAQIKLKPNALLYKGRYCNISKAYERVAKKEIERMVSIDVLNEVL